MALEVFPNDALINSYETSGLLKEVMDLFATALTLDADRELAARWSRTYLQPETKMTLIQHGSLRKVIYNLIFKEMLLKNSTIEVYWDVVCRYGLQNQKAVQAYLASAPRSIALKFGKLLLYKAEFGFEKYLDSEGVRKLLYSVFSVQNFTETIITENWLEKLEALYQKTRNQETKSVLEVARLCRPGSSAQNLCSLFPQLELAKALFLLQKFSQSSDEVCQLMLDKPDQVDKILAGQFSKDSVEQSNKYVKLDEAERQARQDTIRQRGRNQYKYEYTSLEDVDVDLEETDTVHQDISQADRKLAVQEELLWFHWQQSSAMFEKSGRKSIERRQLRTKLNWSDEQIEGWGRMVGSKGMHANRYKQKDEVESYAPRPTKLGTRLPMEFESEKAKKSKPSTKHSKSTKSKDGKSRITSQKHLPTKRDNTKLID